MFILTKQVKIDAAHFLPEHKGKCKDLHGHTWEVEVELRMEHLEAEDGMVADFGELKKLVEQFRWDRIGFEPPDRAMVHQTIKYWI